MHTSRSSGPLVDDTAKAVQLRLIEHDSPEYEQTLKLRDRVLREPLGLTRDPSERQRETGHLHLGGFLDGFLVACLVLQPESDARLRMRQVAVDPTWQRLGIGRRLIERAEEVARERGNSEIVAHARETAIAFYRKLGYIIDPVSFVEVGLVHHLVHKRLT